MQSSLPPKLAPRARRLLSSLLPAFFLLAPIVRAQTTDTELVRKLVTRVDQLEHELAELKGNAVVASGLASKEWTPIQAALMSFGCCCIS